MRTWGKVGMETSLEVTEVLLSVCDRAMLESLVSSKAKSMG